MSRTGEAPDELSGLLARVAAGDERALARLYALASPSMFALLLRMLRKREWAEEALQDSFLKIWQRSEIYAAPRGTPMAWLVTVARQRGLELIRMKRPELSEAELDASPAGHGADVDELKPPAGEGSALLVRCLQGLQPAQRHSLLLAYYEGYTPSDLARKLKAPASTVKSCVRRGLQKVQECLGPA